MRNILLYTAYILIMGICLSPFSEALANEADISSISNISTPENLLESEDFTEANIWHSLISARFKKLTSLNQDLDEFESYMPKKAHRIWEALYVTRKEFQAITTMQQISKAHPIETSMLRGFLLELTQYINSLLIPMHTRFDGIQADMGSLLQLIQLDEFTLSTRSIDEQLFHFLQDLDSTQKRVLQAEKQLTTILEPARALQADIKDLTFRIEKSMPALWKTYYLAPKASPLNPKVWRNLDDKFDDISTTMHMRLNTQIPQNTKAWVGMFVRMLVASSLFFFVYLLQRKQAAKPQTRFTIGIVRLCKNSFFWLCLMFIFCTGIYSNDGLVYYPFIIFASFCMCFFQMNLAWDLYAFSHPQIPFRSMLWPLFILPAIGAVLLFLDLPPVILTCAWFVALLSVFCTLSRKKIPEYPFHLPALIWRAYMPFLLVAMGITLFGWTQLSVLLCMVYIALGIFLQQIFAIVQVSELISKAAPKHGAQGILWGILLAFLVPALLLLSLFLIILCLLPYPGFIYLMAHLTQFAFNVGDTTFSLLQIFLIISAFFITRSCVYVGNSSLTTLVTHNINFNRNLIAPIQVSITYSLWGLFALYTLSVFGFNLTNLAVIAGGLSVGIGFGLQNIINNFVSGLLIIFGQNLREEDVIEVGSVLGVVKKINIRSTTVETFDHATIFVPNSELISGRLTNWTCNGRMVRREISVSVAFGTDIEQVLILLQNIATNNQAILTHPETEIYFKDFMNRRLNFTLKVWIEIVKAPAVEAQLAMEIEKAFRENDIAIV